VLINEDIPSESYPLDSEKDLNLEALPSEIDSRTVFTGWGVIDCLSVENLLEKELFNGFSEIDGFIGVDPQGLGESGNDTLIIFGVVGLPVSRLLHLNIANNEHKVNVCGRGKIVGYDGVKGR
jgi:hypothetical protein